MKIRLIELFKNIKKNIVNFFSISLFIFLGIALFEGLDFAGNAVKRSSQETFNQSNTYDVKLRTGSFLTEEEINGFKSIEGTSDVEGYYLAEDDFMFNGRLLNASITSITTNITKCIPISGRLPKNDNEIVIFGGCAKDLKIDIGDEITFERTNINSFIQNACYQYEQKGIIPSVSGNNKNFNNNTFKVVGTVIYPDMLNHEPNAHPVDFSTGVPVKATFLANYSAFNKEITGNGYNGIHLKNNELDNYDYYEDEYISISDSYKNRIDDYISKNITSKVDYREFLKNNNTIKSVLRDVLHDEGIISDEEYSSDTLFEAKLEEFIKLQEARESIYKTNTRNEIIGTIMCGIESDLFKNERYALGGVFFIISILICYSVITRLVEDEAKLIGTKKALGFRKKEIIFTYLAFTFLGVFIAIILGNVVAFLIEKIVVPIVIKSCFTVIIYTSYFNWLTCAIVSIISFVMIGIITYIACSNQIKKKAIVLLQDSDSNIRRKEGLIEKTKAFQKTSIFNKTVIRNIKKDFKRIFATIIGISSSIALLIASFSLKFTVNDSFNKQFDDYFSFDTVVYMDKTISDAGVNLTSYFEQEEMTYSPIYRDFLSITFDSNETIMGYVYVYFDTDSFNQLVNVDPSTKNPEFENKGFWFPESYQKEFKCKNNTAIEITTLSGETFNTETTGFYRYYNYQCTIFVDKDTYESAFGAPVEINSYLVDRHKIDINEFEKTADTINGYLYSYDYYGKCIVDVGIFDLVLTILYALYLLATILLSFFVVLNLFITNVKEKRREMITLMINGYSRKKASKYIYLDTILLTIISLFVGTGLGLLLSYYGQVSIETKFLYFIHMPSLKAILISLPIAIALVILMTFIALREVKKFKLTNVNNA